MGREGVEWTLGWVELPGSRHGCELLWFSDLGWITSESQALSVKWRRWSWRSHPSKSVGLWLFLFLQVFTCLTAAGVKWSYTAFFLHCAHTDWIRNALKWAQSQSPVSMFPAVPLSPSAATVLVPGIAFPLLLSMKDCDPISLQPGTYLTPTGLFWRKVNDIGFTWCHLILLWGIWERPGPRFRLGSSSCNRGLTVICSPEILHSHP